LSGTLSIEEAFAGFGSRIVVTIGALFVVGGGLRQTGISGVFGRYLAKICGRGEVQAMVAVMAAGALLSSVISNVAAAAILLPAVMALCIKSGHAPSRLLIPLSYGTILGGTLTIIGSQPNIIAGSALKAATGEELGFFALTPIGVLLTGLGIAYVAVAGRRLLPVRHIDTRVRRARCAEELPAIYRLDERLFGLSIGAESLIVGRTLDESELGRRFGINVIGVERPGEERFTPSGEDVIMAGDRLLAQGREEDVNAAARDLGFEVSRKEHIGSGQIFSSEIGVAELVLPPRSSYVGKKLSEIDLRERLGLTVLAIWRGRRPIRARLGEETLKLGDALLVRGPVAGIKAVASSDEFILVSGTDAGRRRMPRAKMLIAVAVLAGMIAAVVGRVLPLPIAALAGAALMITTGCLSPADAYRAVEWRLIIMMGGFLSLGAAMVKTGVIAAFVAWALVPLADWGGAIVLGAVFLMSTAMALAASHITAAVLMSPVALQAASSLDLDPRTLLIGVILGASNGFLTPVAQQSNVLVMGAGNYTSGDYVKAGLGLSLIVFVAVMVFLPLVLGT
jgi:di/tricarboxylate transporter